jgi:ferritin-like metal-binding protein YciE
MNRLRSEPKTHPSVFITLILAALVVVSGGVMHAIYKNSQVQTERLIDQTEKRIDQTHVQIRMIDVHMDKMLDRFEMKDRLKESGSSLVAITPATVDEVDPSKTAAEVAVVRDLP